MQPDGLHTHLQSTHLGSTKIYISLSAGHMGRPPKIGGKPPKLEGENNGNPYEQMGWFGGVYHHYIWKHPYIAQSFFFNKICEGLNRPQPRSVPIRRAYRRWPGRKSVEHPPPVFWGFRVKLQGLVFWFQEKMTCWVFEKEWEKRFMS